MVEWPPARCWWWADGVRLTANERDGQHVRNAGDNGAHRAVTGRAALCCALLALVAFNLRAVILAVPPVLPLVRTDLHLSYAATGLLTSLPVLVMGGLAWPAGLLAGRFGGRAMVALGLALLAAGSLLRAVWPQAVALYLFTALLSVGIAVAQTSLPVLVRQWFPARIGLVTALFTNGLIIGEVIGSGATMPLLQGVLGSGAWRATFVFWSIPATIMLTLWVMLAPPAPAIGAQQETAASPHNSAPHPPARVNPLHLGLTVGMASLVFFGMNAWIATYNTAIGKQSVTPSALVALNAAQLPVTLAMIAFAQRLAGRRWPFVVGGGVITLAIVGWVMTPALLQPLWAGLLGASSAFVFVLGLALPALLARAGEVARLTGAMLALNYGVAFIGPLIGGGLWDQFGLPALAFLPILAAGVVLISLGSLLPERTHFCLTPASSTASSAASTTEAADSALA
jgi:MFS transporter, CP family, cyanate transporter